MKISLFLAKEQQNFQAFCKQVEKLYEKDRKLKTNIDNIVELSAV